MKLLLTFLLVPSAFCLIGRGSVDVKRVNRINRIFFFKFDSNGQLDMDFIIRENDEPNGPLTIIVCSENQYNDLQFADICDENSTAEVDVEFQAELGGAELPLNTSTELTMPRRAWYYVVTVNCEEASYRVTLDWTAVNPGGEFLSLNNVPYKGLFASLATFWILTTAVWSWHWLRYRKENLNIGLQSLMTAVPVTKSIFCLFYMGYWYFASNTGHISDALYWFAFFTEALSLVFFFGSILYLSKGWSLSRKPLNPIEVPQIWLMTLCVVLFYWMYLFFSYYFIALIIVTYVVVLWFCFSKITETMTVLGTQLRDASQDNSGNVIFSTNPVEQEQQVLNEIAPAVSKKRMFQLFRRALASYLAVDAFILFLSPLAFPDDLWIRDMLENLVTIAVVIFIGYVFRHRQYVPTSLNVFGEAEDFNQFRQPPDQYSSTAKTTV